MSTVWLTQTQPSVATIADYLTTHGCNATAMPATSANIHDDLNWHDIQQQCQKADGLVFSSGHAIRAWLAQQQPLNHPCQHQLVAVMGQTSAALLIDAGYTQVICPDAAAQGSEGLLQTMVPLLPSSANVLILGGAIRRGVLELKLHALGHQITVVELYRLEVLRNNIRQLVQQLKATDAIVVASVYAAEQVLSELKESNKSEMVEACYWLAVSPRVAKVLVQYCPLEQIKICQSADAKAIHTCVKSCYDALS